MGKKENIIKMLQEEQYEDGSFGRFHTRNSKLKQKIPTTEAAVWIMYENSITREDEICNKTCIYMENLLNDFSLWPDNCEKNLYYKPAVPLFIASKLALLGSNNEIYNEICNLWINLLISAFKTNKYSAELLNMKSKSLLGVEIDDSYIGLHSLNTLALYAFNTKKIPLNIQKSYLKWLHSYDGIIPYTQTQPSNISQDSKNARVISLLAKFEGFKVEFPQLIC